MTDELPGLRLAAVRTAAPTLHALLAPLPAAAAAWARIVSDAETAYAAAAGSAAPDDADTTAELCAPLRAAAFTAACEAAAAHISARWTTLAWRLSEVADRWCRPNARGWRAVWCTVFGGPTGAPLQQCNACRKVFDLPLPASRHAPLCKSAYGEVTRRHDLVKHAWISTLRQTGFIVADKPPCARVGQPTSYADLAFETTTSRTLLDFTVVQPESEAAMRFPGGAAALGAHRKALAYAQPSGPPTALGVGYSAYGATDSASRALVGRLAALAPGLGPMSTWSFHDLLRRRVNAALQYGLALILARWEDRSVRDLFCAPPQTVCRGADMSGHSGSIGGACAPLLGFVT